MFNNDFNDFEEYNPKEGKETWMEVFLRTRHDYDAYCKSMLKASVKVQKEEFDMLLSRLSERTR